jgi:hypothetical protein
MDRSPPSAVERRLKDPSLSSEALLASARATRIDFLRAEIRIANTMLDLAATSRNAGDRERRRDRAREACGEVARHLAVVDSVNAVNALQREELSTAVRGVERRLAL